MWPTISCTPRRARVDHGPASAALSAIGFSTITCLPAPAATIVSGQCAEFAETMNTASMSGMPDKFLRELKASGIEHSSGFPPRLRGRPLLQRHDLGVPRPAYGRRDRLLGEPSEPDDPVPYRPLYHPLLPAGCSFACKIRPGNLRCNVKFPPCPCPAELVSSEMKMRVLLVAALVLPLPAPAQTGSPPLRLTGTCAFKAAAIARTAGPRGEFADPAIHVTHYRLALIFPASSVLSGRRRCRVVCPPKASPWSVRPCGHHDRRFGPGQRGPDLPYTQYLQGLQVNLPRTYRRGDTLTLDTYYRGSPVATGFGSYEVGSRTVAPGYGR